MSLRGCGGRRGSDMASHSQIRPSEGKFNKFANGKGIFDIKV